MDLESLQAFFFWCLIINIGIYSLTLIAYWAMRDFVCRLNARIFDVSEETIRKTVFSYIAAYKLLIIVFNFVPWLVILIIK